MEMTNLSFYVNKQVVGQLPIRFLCSSLLVATKLDTSDSEGIVRCISSPSTPSVLIWMKKTCVTDKFRS
jgi:hypothetical protein